MVEDGPSWRSMPECPRAAAYARLPYAYALCPNPYGFSKTFSAPSLRWAIS